MTSHVDGETMLGWLDGELDAVASARVAAHLQGCGDCMARLERQAEFEARFAEPLPAALAARMRSVTRREFARGPTLSRRRGALWLAAAALAMASGALLWQREPSVVRVQVARTGTTRGPNEARVFLEVTLPTPGYIAVFGRRRGDVERMLPAADPVLGDLGVPQPAPAGVVTRVPGVPLFDFELSVDRRLTAVLVVITEARLDAQELGRVAQLWRATSGEGVPDSIRRAHPRTVWQAVPRD